MPPSASEALGPDVSVLPGAKRFTFAEDIQLHVTLVTE